MSNLSVFQFSQSPVQFVDHPQGTYSFGIVADDLAAIVGAPSGADLARSVDDQWKGSHTVRTPGGAQKKVVIWEPGLYQYLAVSRKPIAKQFQVWLFETVLPEIRRTGSYQGGSGQAEGCPDWFYRLRVFRRNTKIPVGWFCIFEEIAGLMADFEEAGYSLPMGSVPDISVGKCFAQHLKANNIPTDGMIRYYLHIYPDGREVDARIYSYDLLPEFKQWFNATYRVSQLKGYLKRKDPQALNILQNILTAYEESEQRFIA
jgi:hypothetical protein